MSTTIKYHTIALAIAALLSLQVAHAESLKKGLKRIGHQAKVNAENLGKRIERDATNTIRLYTEDRCDREGRKHGPEAKRACLSDSESTSAGGGSGYRSSYYASMEIECWKPGHFGRWGTSTISQTSYVSREDAMHVLFDRYNNSNICETRWGDSTLQDGDYRWVHN